VFGLDRRALRRIILRSVGRGLPPARRLGGRIRRVLVVRPDHIGDVLLCAPALRRLRAALPDAHVTLLVGPWSAAAAEGLPDVDAVLVYAMPGFEYGLGAIEPYRRARELAGRLARERFDVALILRADYWWGALVAKLAGIPVRVGFDVAEARPFLTRAIPPAPDCHEAEKDGLIVAAALAQASSDRQEARGGMGEDGRDRPAAFGEHSPPLNRLADPLVFRTGPADEAFAEVWVGTSGPFVVLHPPSRAPVKRWTVGGFAAVARHLRRRGWEVVVTGAEGERALVERVVAACAGARPLVGAPLGALAAVLRRAELVVGVDSGVLHLAVAVGTPSVALFGPIAPAIFGPWGDPARHRYVTTRMACAPCARLDYRPEELVNHPCTPLIPAGEVISAAEAALSAGSAGGAPALPAQQAGAPA
jgi:heptosyltransferase-2/heptosyltransferase-3